MRCVGSSPAAAGTLRNRLAADPDRLAEQVFDDDDDADAVDVEPATDFGADADPALASLLEQAEASARRRIRSSTRSPSCSGHC